MDEDQEEFHDASEHSDDADAEAETETNSTATSQ